jgi:hypothetical protein
MPDERGAARSWVAVVSELLLWSIIVNGLAACLTPEVSLYPGGYNIWSPLQLPAFAALAVACYRAGRAHAPYLLVVGFVWLSSLGFLPLLLPDGFDRYALLYGMASPWFFVGRTTVFMAAMPIIFGYIASIGRRMARVPDHPVCRACGYNLTGNVSGRCPECGARVDAHDSPRSATP